MSFSQSYGNNMDSSSDEEEDATDLFCVPTQDLFSDRLFNSAQEYLQFARKEYDFDLPALIKEHHLDCFSFIQFINYIRAEKPTNPKSITKLLNSNMWRADKYMKPVLPEDGLLMLDPEDFQITNGDSHQEEEEKMPELVGTEETKTTPEQALIISQDESTVTISQQTYKNLRSEIGILRQKMMEKDEEMESVLEDMQKMKMVAQKLMGQDEPEDTPCSKLVNNNDDSVDQHYATSYSHFGIHHEMLSDKVRTISYRDAILKNAESSIKNRNVLDLGCGTGILSMFCAQSGARRVVGVDMSTIIHQAMDIVRENELHDRIALVKGKLEDVELPIQEFDVIVSEWMGYFLLFEGMLDSVIEARDKYLKRDGMILPNRCTMHLVAVDDGEKYDELVNFWSDVYGFKMNCMKKPVLVEASVEIVPSSKVISTQAKIHDLDIMKCTLKDTEFETDFELCVTKDGFVTSLAGYFDTFFDLPEIKVSFGTGPQEAPTHWKQTVFYLTQKMRVSSGEIIKGHIKVERPARDLRALEVKLEINGTKEFYTIE